jgi:hypothetical protein|tara:strand:- start:6166 stop:7821 length:1656 start_codon:yes stop_codon:yes gene_type:complete
MQLFGFQLTRADSADKEKGKAPSFAPPAIDDGSIEVAPGGAYGTHFDFEGAATNEGQLITRYRDMSITAECDAAVQDIVNEAIVISDDGDVLEINTDKIKVGKDIQKKIQEEFAQILSILDFNNEAHNIFRKWYVDGRIFYNVIVNLEKPKEGIKELRYVDPRRIKKVKEPIRLKDPKTGVIIHKGYNEYYIYHQKGIYNQNTQQGVKIAKDSVCYTHSGVLDGKTNTVYSHLQKAVKTLNQLRVLEDSVVIYRLVRAPERRIFYIDVGNLPKLKAEQYVRDMMTKHKNKVVYDASSGEVKDSRRYMTMLEDFWLPRREGGRGTEITTLPGGQNLGEMEDVEYFRRKLYKSLNVPFTRLDVESSVFNIGRSQEITRDEIKFSKFIDRIRNQFSKLFDQLLETQLVLKGIIRPEEWDTIRQQIDYDFQNDNHFTELKEAEMIKERLGLLDQIDQYVGRYYSKDYVRRHVLKMSEEDLEYMDKQMDKEGDDTMSPDLKSKELGLQQQQQELEMQAKETGAPPTAKQESVESTEEEKELLESMTRFMDSITEED